MRQLLWVASFLWQLSASSAEGTMLHFENFKVHLKNWLLCYVKHIYTFPPHYFNCLARSLFVVFTKINIYISIFYAFYHLRCWVLKETDYEQNVKKFLLPSVYSIVLETVIFCIHGDLLTIFTLQMSIILWTRCREMMLRIQTCKLHF